MWRLFGVLICGAILTACGGGGSGSGSGGGGNAINNTPQWSDWDIDQWDGRQQGTRRCEAGTPPRGSGSVGMCDDTAIGDTETTTVPGYNFVVGGQRFRGSLGEKDFGNHRYPIFAPSRGSGVTFEDYHTALEHDGILKDVRPWFSFNTIYYPSVRTIISFKWGTATVEDIYNAHTDGWTGRGKTIRVPAEQQELVAFIAHGARQGAAVTSGNGAILSDTVSRGARSVTVHFGIEGTSDTRNLYVTDDIYPRGQNLAPLNAFAASVTALVGHKFADLTNAQAWEIVKHTGDTDEDVEGGPYIPDLPKALSPIGNLR